MVVIEEIKYPSDNDSSKENHENEDENDFDIDFTKPCPEDMVPPFPDIPIDSVDNSEQEDIEDDDFFSNDNVKVGNQTSSKDDSLGSKRAILLLLMFPMLFSAVVMLSDAVFNINLPGPWWRIGAGFCLVTVILVLTYTVPVFRSSFKTILCLSLALLLLPTYQVYRCSPIELKNDMLGTWFSLNTDASTFLEKSFITSKCYKKNYIPTSYYLSLIPLKMNLKVDINHLISLQKNDNGGHIDNKDYGKFLLLSKRSVHKKFHKLNLITIVSTADVAENLENALKLETDKKDRTMLLLSGHIKSLDDQTQATKTYLEKMQYLVRPIKFVVHTVEYVDRYAKLKNAGDSSLY